MQGSAAPSGPGMVETHESLERAVKMSRPSPWGWIIAALCVVCLLIVIGKLVIDRSRKNPRPEEIVRELEPENAGLAMLGERRTGAGYSFRLPETFVTAPRPSTDQLPAGTKSYAWMAEKGSEQAGSEFRVWVIPVELNIQEALHEMNSAGTRLDYYADITQRSTYRRIGNDIIAVAGRLDGSDSRVSRKGIIYVMYDRAHRNTLLVLGMGAGQMYKEVQFMLDHAARTIRYER